MRIAMIDTRRVKWMVSRCGCGPSDCQKSEVSGESSAPSAQEGLAVESEMLASGRRDRSWEVSKSVRVDIRVNVTSVERVFNSMEYRGDILSSPRTRGCSAGGSCSGGTDWEGDVAAVDMDSLGDAVVAGVGSGVGSSCCICRGMAMAIV